MKRWTSKSYTLVEMAMVLGIIAVSMLIITPKMSAFINVWELDAEVNKVKAKIREAQQLAIAEQTNYRVFFNIVGDFYQITKDIGGGVYQNVEAPAYKNDVHVTGTTWSLPAMNTLQFDQFGAPFTGGTITFQHTVTGAFKAVTIQSVTGKLT